MTRFIPKTFRRPHVRLPRYTGAERRVDAIIHVIGLIFGLAACTTLVTLGLMRADATLLIALGLYGAGLLAMLGFSALYHLTSKHRLRPLLRRLDHAAIFVMIAGTYTPFATIAIGGRWGLGLLIFVWTVALTGAALKLFLPHRFEKLSIAAYLALGWTVLVVLNPLIEALSMAGFALLAAGGFLYSLGVVFHLWEKLPFQNAIWHALVIVAAACHFSAIILDVATV